MSTSTDNMDVQSSRTSGNLAWTVLNALQLVYTLIWTAGWKVGRTRLSAICRESSEPSSSAMPTERLVASVTAPVATVLTEIAP